MWIFFLEKQFFLIRVLCYFQHWKVPLHLLVKWEVVSPNSREGQLQSISIIFIILVVILYFKWGGGGVMFFSHFMLFPTFLEEKNLGIQNNYFSFNVFFVFFFVYWKYCKVPLHLQLLVKWEVVSPNGRYIGNVIMRLAILKSSPSLTG